MPHALAGQQQLSLPTHFHMQNAPGYKGEKIKLKKKSNATLTAAKQSDYVIKIKARGAKGAGGMRDSFGGGWMTKVA